MQSSSVTQNLSRSGHILFLCFLTYLTAYLLRTNYSAALPLMLDQMSMTEAQLGIAGSAFFIAYAAGQLLNGFLADAVNPGRFVIFALIGTIIANTAMGLCEGLWTLAAVWACNGYFQSIFWGCLQRILSLHFNQKRHAMVATVMSSSMVAGFILSWVVLRNVLAGKQWQQFFFLPALCGTILLAVWLLAGQRLCACRHTSSTLSFRTIRTSLQLIAEKRIYLICGICLCLGFIKESISVWGPTMIAQVLGIDLQMSSVILFIIPLGNLVGIFWAKHLAEKNRKSRISILFPLFGSIFLASLLLTAGDQMVLAAAAMMVIVSAMSYGCNSVLLSMIPLLYTKYGIVSTLIGFFDFSSYIGASISSVAAGVLLTSGNWKILPLLWLITAAAALGLALLAEKKTVQA